MKKRKIKIIIFSAILIICITGVVWAYNNDFFKNWGVFLSENSKTNEKNMKSDKYTVLSNTLADSITELTEEDDIFEIGKDVIILQSDVERAVKFYEEAGYEKEDAYRLGVEYEEKYSAMYALALKNGFQVSVDEVDDKIEELQKLFLIAENRDQLNEVMNGFSSEEEYWNYEKEVYKKSLPIENYRIKLEEEYKKKQEANKKMEDLQSEWIVWYEEFQRQEAENQHFVKLSELSEDVKLDKLAVFLLN